MDSADAMAHTGRAGRIHEGVEMDRTHAPDILPMLSRGKHRTPADGGCFMEFASYLAGERWSDHPSCTHPLLASLARLVNDAVSDHRRPALAPLVPQVVGLDHDDVAFDALVARRCAVTALPLAPAEQQRALAVAVLAAEDLLAPHEGRPEDLPSDDARRAFALAPAAVAWARDLAEGQLPSARAYRRHAAPTAVRCAVQGILSARLPDPDPVLEGLLATVVEECRAFVRTTTPPVDSDRWRQACDLLDHGVAAG